MDEANRKKMEKKITIYSIALLVVLVAFMITVGVLHMADTILFPIGIGFCLALYWVLTDVLSVKWLEAFDGKTDEQKKAYYIYALLDAVGFAGLTYFIVDMKGSTGAIIYVAALFMKKRYKEEFRGKTTEENADAEIVDTETDDSIENGRK